MPNDTLLVKSRFPEKFESHNILVGMLKKLYTTDKMNTAELSRLADIGYERLRRLLFDDAVWTVDEWFKVVVVTGSTDAIALFYESQQKHLIKYQQSERYKKKLPRWEPESRKLEHEHTLAGKRRDKKRKMMYKKAEKRAIKESKKLSKTNLTEE